MAANVTTSRGIISDSAQFYINVWFFGLVIPLVCLFGIVSNVVNIIVFLRQGVTDCVTLTLLFLAFSDLGIAASTCGLTVPYSFDEHFPENVVNLLSIGYFIGWIRGFFLDLSMVTTAFLSLQKSLCVAWPFRFKDVFTVKRTAYVLAGITAYAISVTIPNFATVGLKWQFDGRTNSTKLLLWFSQDRPVVEFGNHIVHISMSSLIQALVIICAYILTKGILQSRKFRLQKTTQQSEGAATAALSDKELRLVKMVSLLATVFVLCNVPDLLFMYINTFVDDFHVGRKYTNMYFTLAGLAFLFQAINASVNIFIYVKYNPKFKSVVDTLFRCKGK